MSEFICVMKQSDEGCDYSIECGTGVYAFEANNWDDAFKKVKKAYDWDDYEGDDYSLNDLVGRFECELSLESCVIYKVDSKMETLYETWLNNLKRKKLGIDGENELAARRAEYEQLKAEFGD